MLSEFGTDDDCPDCRFYRDYDGERIWTHCDEHCPKVVAGKQEHCRGC